MTGKLELVYSTQRTGYEQGRAYANPRFFISPRSGIKRVIVVGNFPAVVDAYRAQGVTVVEVESGHATLEEAIAGGRELPGIAPGGPEANGGNVGDDVEIPDEETFEALDWSEKRQLVKSLGGAVTSKDAAREFINEKRAARAAAAEGGATDQ